MNAYTQSNYDKVYRNLSNVGVDYVTAHTLAAEVARDYDRTGAMPDIYIEGGILFTDSGKLADAAIHAHAGHANLDTESLTFGCYSHDEYMGVRFTG